MKVVLHACAVSIIYLTSVGVLWALTLIGGPITAVVEGVLKQNLGNIWFATGGLLAAFVVITSIGFFAVYAFLKAAAAAQQVATTVANTARQLLHQWGI